jgi:hypothetical protein
MRWTFAGLLAAGGLITVFCLGWSLPPAAPERAAEDGSWQVRELAYLKSAYDRMQQERLQQAGEGEIEGGASLRREQQRIIRQMAQTAKLLPNEAVSDELRALLQGAASMPVPAPLQCRSRRRFLPGRRKPRDRIPKGRRPGCRSGLQANPARSFNLPTSRSIPSFASRSGPSRSPSDRRASSRPAAASRAMLPPGPTNRPTCR